MRRQPSTGMEFRQAVKYPTRTDNWLVQTFLGGVMWALSPFLLPLVVVLGYYIHNTQHLVDGGDTLLEFDDWSKYFELGIRGTVIVLAYSVIPFIGMVASVGVIGSAMGIQQTNATLFTIGLFSFFASIVVWIALLPGALIHMGHQNSLKAGFKIGELSRIWTSKKYLLTTTILLVATVVAQLLLNIFVLVTIGFGLFLIPFMINLFCLVALRFYADDYQQVMIADE